MYVCTIYVIPELQHRSESLFLTLVYSLSPLPTASHDSVHPGANTAYIFIHRFVTFDLGEFNIFH